MAQQAATGFEGGTLNANVPTNGSDFFDAGSVTTTGTATYSDLHVHASSARSALLSNNNDSTAAVFRTRTITASATGVYRAYFTITAFPSATTTIMSVFNGANKVGDLRMSATGVVSVRDLNTTTKTFTSNWFLNTLHMFEWLVAPNATNGTQTIRYQRGVNLDTASFNESLTGTATGAGQTQVTEFRLTVSTGLTGTFEIFVDDVAAGDTAFLGPVGGGSGGAVNVSAPPMEMDVSMPAVDTGSGTDIRPNSLRHNVFMGTPSVLAVSHPFVAASPMQMLVRMVPPVFLGNPRPDKSAGIVEVESSPGVWVSLDTDVRLDGALDHTFGRPTPFDPPTPGTMRIVLDNSTGNYTPGNPASIYAPWFAERIGLRVFYIKGTTRIPRFTGQIDSLELDIANPLQSRVVVTASDTCARLGRRRMSTLVQEAVLSTPDDVCAFLPLDDAEDATTLRNLGTTQGVVRRPAALGTATFSDGALPGAIVVPSKTLLGTSKIGGQMAGIVGAGAIELTRGEDSPCYGPVVYLPRNLAGTVEFWCTTSDQGAVTPGGQQPLGQLILCSAVANDRFALSIGYDAGGLQRLKVWDPGSSTYHYAAGNTPFVNDGQPHHYRIEAVLGGRYGAAGQTRVYVDQQRVITIATSPWVAASCDTIVLGGLASPLNRGSQQWVANATYSFLATYTETRSTDPAWQYARVDSQTDADDRVIEILRWTGATSSEYLVDTDNSVIGPQNAAGRTALELLQDLTATTGGVIYAQPDGTLRYANAASLHPSTVTATLDAAGDLEVTDGLVWVSEIDTKPTAVTASSDGAAGSVTISQALSDQTLRQEESIATAAGSVAQLAGAASYRLNRGVGRRLRTVNCNLYTATTDHWSELGAPQVGARVRIASLPSALLGVSYEDYFIQGGRVSTGKDPQQGDFYRVSLDLSLADDPPVGVWDGQAITGDAKTYGRFAGDGLALSAAISSGATSAVVVTPAGSARLSSTGGDYPMQLRIGAERVGVASAPSSGTRTNLISNPSFETNTTGWSGVNAAVIARVSTFVQVGSWAGRVTWAAGSAHEEMVVLSVTTTIGEPYSLQLQAYVPTGAPAVYPVAVGLMDGDLSTVNDSWQMLQALAFVATSTTTQIGLALGEDTLAGTFAYLDAVLCEHGTVAGAYMDTTASDGQTITITRGVAPTVAVAHPIGTVVDVWHPATWAI